MTDELEQWKLKRLIKSLDDLQGGMYCTTSMISLIIPANSNNQEIPRVIKMLNDEAGTTTNIKSRVNRLSVQSAITSAVQKLKTCREIPKNGLVMFCGTATDAYGKEKKISILFSPFRPIHMSLYYCDSKFHTEHLLPLTITDEKYGFIIVDGNGVLFGVLQGNDRRVIRVYEVDLPKKQGKGGQSAQRFGRIRLERRHNYIVKVGEMATSIFLTDNVPNVKAIIVAGSGEFKLQLRTVLDARVDKLIIASLDVAYGGENGFSQAIVLAENTIQNSKYMKEKNIITTFMTAISKDLQKVCYGTNEVIRALESKCIETLIVWENIPLYRYVDENDVVSFGAKKETGFVDEQHFADWIAVSYNEYGCRLEIVSNASGEGMQFVMGFGGIGGLLRYAMPESIDSVEETLEETHIEKTQDLDYDEDFL